MVFQLIMTIATSLVPYKSLCWSPRFGGMKHLPALPRMLCNRQSDHPLHLITDTNVTICFQHRLFNITRLQSLIHSIQLDNTHLQESCSRFSLSFTTKKVSVQCSIRWFANYLWRSSAEVQFSSFPYTLASLFARPPHVNNDCQEPSIFCTTSLSLQLDLVQDTHVCA